MFHYERSLIAKCLFPEVIETCSFTSINSEDHISFSNHPDSMALIIITADMTATLPSSSKLDEKLKVSYSPAESFKKSIKKYSSFFDTFKEGKHWDTWRRNILATDRLQDIAKVINPDYRPVTQDDVNLLKEKQKFMCVVFDKTLLKYRGKKYVRE